MQRVLIASPIKQKPAILQEFLCSLEQLDRTNFEVSYSFVDDNEEKSLLLENFSLRHPRVYLVRGEGYTDRYHCDEATHYWPDDLTWKVARYKDGFIDYALKHKFDYLFLVDSDLSLHPKTLVHLESLKKEIVSEVFWTQWQPDAPKLPQVWLGGHYRLHEENPGEKLSSEEMSRRQQQFLDKLKCPGTYQVGGLGACTMISRKALEMGVSFRRIYNLDLWGEDRHFCIRAATLGLMLYADTFYPPYHMYRESELTGLSFHKQRYNYYTGEDKKPRLTLAMLVRNEAGRYLREVLTQAVQFADEIVILDDASTDNTVELCREYGKPKLSAIKSNSQWGFNNEVILRKQLWDMAVATNPDWIMILDADELFEDEALAQIPQLLLNTDVDGYSFRLYDMWSDTHYREDCYWYAHTVYRPFLVRYKLDHLYVWKEVPLHCGRFPYTIYSQRICRSQLRVKHMGWARPEVREYKFNRYKTLDPEARYGIKAQYASILDPNPRLIPWEEKDG